MAANSQQGSYLALTLTGFTALAAGLVTTASSAGLGWTIAVIGLVLLGVSFTGFVRIKHLEARK